MTLVTSLVTLLAKSPDPLSIPGILDIPSPRRIEPARFSWYQEYLETPQYRGLNS